MDGLRLLRRLFRNSQPMRSDYTRPVPVASGVVELTRPVTRGQLDNLYAAMNHMAAKHGAPIEMIVVLK